MSLTTLLLAAEEGGAEHAEEASGLALVLPEAAELIWGLVSFIIVLGFLSRVAFPRLKQAIAEREQTIQGNLEEAEKAKADAQRELEEYRSKLADSRGEANRIIEEARQSAEQVRKDLIEKAEREAQQVTERAQEQIAAERDRTIRELQQQIADLSIELAEKVVGRSIDAGAQKELVDAYIKEVAGMGNGGAKR
jgi:F-type H+-transporting ATPase subunit b